MTSSITGKTAVKLGMLLALFALPVFRLHAQSSTQDRSPTVKAWQILDAGVVDSNVNNRAMAVQVLGLLPGNAKARMLAENALNDSKTDVRAAGATALGKMKAKAAAAKLRLLVKNEKEISVVLAAASALLAIGDPAAYEVYYAILTGERKSGAALLEQQRKMLSDPKKMAQFGFETGVGFIPFGGLGLSVFKSLNKDDSSPVRAAAAQVLIRDPDPRSGEALVQATSDKSWVVRAAALDALAQRGDRRLVPKIEPAMDDQRDAVRYTAAAAVVRLSGPAAKAAAPRKP